MQCRLFLIFIPAIFCLGCQSTSFLSHLEPSFPNCATAKKSNVVEILEKAKKEIKRRIPPSLKFVDERVFDCSNEYILLLEYKREESLPDIWRVTLDKTTNEMKVTPPE